MDNIPITPDEQAMFDTTQAIYDINGSLDVKAQSSIVVTKTGASARSQGLESAADQPSASKTITAFDAVANNHYMQLAIDQMTDWGHDFFGTYATYTRVLLADLSTLATKVVPLSPTTITDMLIFPDGSSVLVRWNYTLQRYEYLPGSAKDSVGNPIPVSQQEVTGGASYKEYTFPPTTNGLLAGISQIENLDRMGVRTNFPAGVTLNGWFIISCTNIGTGPVCTIVHNRGD